MYADLFFYLSISPLFEFHVTPKSARTLGELAECMNAQFREANGV
jgi:hypothetical protein